MARNKGGKGMAKDGKAAMGGHINPCPQGRMMDDNHQPMQDCGHDTSTIPGNAAKVGVKGAKRV